ncbi:hypothetical protein GHT09_016106 [Marmota monax]|uniref:Purple acid phosphatase C-terminal domain-containing protein n=1 Tax=Marmota monax TaxID=9995 RepID=A0A834UVC4_MARMO|nr:hypothetical protein GHT09_016106 [Marmota monax]
MDSSRLGPGVLESSLRGSPVAGGDPPISSILQMASAFPCASPQLRGDHPGRYLAQGPGALGGCHWDTAGCFPRNPKPSGRKAGQAHAPPEHGSQLALSLWGAAGPGLTAPPLTHSSPQGCEERLTPFSISPGPWSALRVKEYGYTRLHILNGTHVHIQQVSDDQDGKIVDDVWVVRPLVGRRMYH